MKEERQPTRHSPRRSLSKSPDRSDSDSRRPSNNEIRQGRYDDREERREQRRDDYLPEWERRRSFEENGINDRLSRSDEPAVKYKGRGRMVKFNQTVSDSCSNVLTFVITLEIPRSRRHACLVVESYVWPAAVRHRLQEGGFHV